MQRPQQQEFLCLEIREVGLAKFDVSIKTYDARRGHAVIEGVAQDRRLYLQPHSLQGRIVAPVDLRHSAAREGEKHTGCCGREAQLQTPWLRCLPKINASLSAGGRDALAPQVGRRLGIYEVVVRVVQPVARVQLRSHRQPGVRDQQVRDALDRAVDVERYVIEVLPCDYRIPSHRVYLLFLLRDVEQ